MNKIIVLFIFSFITANAQDDYQKWLKQEKNKYDKFQSEEDKKFYDFLKKEWKEFNIQPGISSDKEPKPIVIPEKKTTPKEYIIPKSKETSVKNEVITQTTEKEKSPIEEINNSQQPQRACIQIPAIEGVGILKSEIDYYDGNIDLIYPELFTIRLEGNLSNETIAEYWRQLNTTSSKEFVKDLVSFKSMKKLNDWAYFELANRISKMINSNRPQESLLLTWFVLLQSGYKVKTGLINNDLYLFVKCKELIFDKPYFNDGDGEKTYLINFYERKPISGSLFSYEGDYPKAKFYLSLQINEPPELYRKLIDKQFQLNYNTKIYSIPVLINNNIIDFYRNYPATQYDTYFRAKVSDEIHKSLVVDLKELVQGMDTLESINFLLRFVQTCFEYEVDEKNFGHEKALFVEETLFYSASDCEDRAILFSFLIRNVLGLKVIGIDYPGHIATAVQSSVSWTGDKVKHKGNEYLICDPTYIDANAGMSMPSHPVNTIENIIEIE